MAGRQSCFGAMIVWALSACGCGDSRLTCYPASGQVLVRGQPAEGALVVLHPVASEPANGPRPTATTDADGRFRLTTYEAADGAPPGNYRVTVRWPPKKKGPGDDGPDRLGNRYSDPLSSRLTVTVGSQPIEFEPFRVD